MPRNRFLLVVALMSASSVAAGEPKLGVTVDAGLPDGANAALVYRPISRIRLHAGGSHNAVSYGARAGVTLAPLRTWLSPTLSLDYGRYSDGNANPLVQMVSGDGTLSSSVLERFGYSYTNAHIGLEFGRTRATFYIHAGMSHVPGKLRGLSETLPAGDMTESGTTITFSEVPTFSATTASARIGLIVYFL